MLRSLLSASGTDSSISKSIALSISTPSTFVQNQRSGIEIHDELSEGADFRASASPQDQLSHRIRVAC